MAKRKSAKRKPAKKIKTKLETSFKCLECNAEKSVSVKCLTNARQGILTCKSCSASHTMALEPPVSQPIDVYADWVDNFSKIPMNNYSRPLSDDEDF